MDPELIVPDQKSVAEGAVEPWSSTTMNWYPQTLVSICKHYGASPDTPWHRAAGAGARGILYGSGDEQIADRARGRPAQVRDQEALRGRGPQPAAALARDRIGLDARGAVALHELDHLRGLRRLPAEARGAVRQDRRPPHRRGYRALDPGRRRLVRGLPAQLTAKQQEIAARVLKEIRERLGFLDNVGLDYLTLARDSGTLSGGESQRIRLASQIGSRPDRRALRAGRALDRPAPARQRPAARDAPQPARPRQHGDRGRARRGRDPRGRPSDRHGPGRRRPWRRGRRRGHARRGHARAGLADRPVSVRPPRDPCAGEAPQGQERRAGSRSTAAAANNLQGRRRAASRSAASSASPACRARASPPW